MTWPEALVIIVQTVGVVAIMCIVVWGISR